MNSRWRQGQWTCMLWNYVKAMLGSWRNTWLTELHCIDLGLLLGVGTIKPPSCNCVEPWRGRNGRCSAGIGSGPEPKGSDLGAAGIKIHSSHIWSVGGSIWNHWRYRSLNSLDSWRWNHCSWLIWKEEENPTVGYPQLIPGLRSYQLKNQCANLIGISKCQENCPKWWDPYPLCGAVRSAEQHSGAIRSLADDQWKHQARKKTNCLSNAIWPQMMCNDDHDLINDLKTCCCWCWTRRPLVEAPLKGKHSWNKQKSWTAKPICWTKVQLLLWNKATSIKP